MTDTSEWDLLREERQAVVERFRALPFESAWGEVRAAIENDPGSPDGTTYVYESSPRGTFLTPLPTELVNAFVEGHGERALDALHRHAGDPNPLVAAYSLLALFNADDSRLVNVALRVANRTEFIRTVDDCFAWSGTLAEYARKLSNEYVETLDDASDASPETEAAWMRAEFDRIGEAIMTGRTPSRHPFWEYSQLADLAARIGKRDVLERLLNVTRHLVLEMPAGSRIVIAETLVGRDSPIRLARALGDSSLANQFAELVPAFCDTSEAPRGGAPIEVRRASVLTRLQEL